jgi:cytochrome c oxidase subunit 2
MTPDTLNRRAVLHAAGAFTLATLTAGVAAAQATKPRVIRVVAKKFEFVPAEIRVRPGEAVTLLFTAPEVPMGFNLADFQLRVDIVPGQVARLDFKPDRAGRFTFLCDVFCGSGHEEMSGTLVVA